MPRATILVVERDEELRSVMEEHLAAGGYKVISLVAFPDGAFEKAGESDEAECIILSTSSDGAEPRAILKRCGGRTPVIFVADPAPVQNTIPEIVEAMRNGAADFLMKPVDGVTLMRSVHRALRYRALEHRVRRLESENARLAGREGGLVGRSEALLRIVRSIEKIAPSASPVLILGETGAGKELVAREIHERSGRGGDFVAVNAASLGEQLFEAELFGYEPGAFTGAKGRKLGLVEVADGGTLFLDEIGDLSAPVQARLLRFLDDGRFRRLGGLREVETDVRIVAATNRDVETLAAGARPAGRALDPSVRGGSADHPGQASFRSDLYYRLAAFTIRLPPLRDRTEDIPLLLEHFVRIFEAKTGRAAPGIAHDIHDVLRRHDWPGNVREFHNFVDKMLFTYSDETIISAGMAVDLLPSKQHHHEEAADPLSWKSRRSQRIAEIDRELLADVIRRNGYNISAAAREIGVDRKTLAHRLKELKIAPTER